MSTKTLYLQTVGEYFHVYNRGVNRQKIFYEKRNYSFFLKRMEEYRTSGILIVSFCLMPNHFHFVLRQDEPNAMSKYFGRLCKSYTRAINKLYQRTGHLFEGKYKIKHIDDRGYLIHLTRYVHLNPVRGGLVATPKNWEFSSFNNYYMPSTQGLVDTSILLAEFQNSAAYAEYVQDYVLPDNRKLKKYLFTRP